jgi:trans-aconitate methyltransferase
MTHEFDGKKYTAASAHQKEWGAKLIQELSISGTERILDLGCGDGVLTAQLAALAPQGAVVGIDASYGMIEAAKSHQAENLSFEVRDINGLDFESEFDIIFSNATLHWIKNHEALLGNAFRALKSGGILKFNFAGDGNSANFFSAVKDTINLPQFARHFSDFEWPWFMPTIEEYELLGQSIPFTESRVWGENADRFFADTETMIKWIDQPSLVPFMKLVPDEQKIDFRQFVIDRMIQKTRQVDGRCFETFRRINLVAKKGLTCLTNKVQHGVRGGR